MMNQSKELRKWAMRTCLAIVGVTVIAFWFIVGYIAFSPEFDIIPEHEDGIAVVTVRGDLGLVADADLQLLDASEIAKDIEWYSSDPDVDVIILDIYSYGGVATAGELIMNALKRSDKRTIALVSEDVLSAGYLAATGADTIYANRFATVGGIGVTSSYLDETEKNRQEGLQYIDISSAEFKDLYNPNRPITPEGLEEMRKTVEGLHQLFVETVAENRGLPIEVVAELATGSSFLAEEALEYGLIDHIGDLYTIKKALK